MSNMDTTWKHLFGAESSPTQKVESNIVMKFIEHLQLDDKLKDSCGNTRQQSNRLGGIFTFR